MMNDEQIFRLIVNEIKRKKLLNNTYDDTYIRRLKYYPEYFKMSYWENYREYVDIKQYLIGTDFRGKILDFGCGSGHMDILLARDGYRVHGVDLSPMAIGISNILKKNEYRRVKSKISFSLEDITEENIKNEKFDLVWSSHTLEHIKEHEPILNGIRKRVEPGTKMIVSVPLGYAFDDINHVQHWNDAAEFREFFEKIVEVEEVVANPVKETIISVFIL